MPLGTTIFYNSSPLHSLVSTFCNTLSSSTHSLQCGSICRDPPFPLASPAPPDYTLEDNHHSLPLSDLASSSSNKQVFSAFQPTVTFCLDVNSQWRFPLLTCRALSTGPAIWWGFRCGLTFLGELLRGEGAGLLGGEWEVEKRFRVTEVFLAILWVRPEQESTA